jgi:SAM-dependent methyltransferase
MTSQHERWDRTFAGLELGAPIYDLWLDQFEQKLEKSRDLPVVDLGCGYGCDTLYLVERDYSVIACDFSKEALLKVEQFVPEAQTMRLDLTESLPFETDSKMLIIADLSLHYFAWEKTKEIISEIKRILMDGGALLCRLNSTKDVLFGAGQGTIIEPNYYEWQGERKRFFDEASIQELFTDWKLEHVLETEMNRYGKPKICWEIAATHEQNSKKM